MTDITGRTRVFAILADPIAQVKAPQGLNRIMAERGVDGVMVPLHVAADDLATVLAGLRAVRSFGGAIITVPHKTTIVPLLDSVSDAARLVGAVNAVRREPDGRLVGFVYGLPNDRAHWWSTVVQPYLWATGSDHWLDDSFVITELHVHPGHQNRGIGRSLITNITDGAAEPRSILSAIDTDSPARGLYHSLGYQDLARQVLFPSAPKPYAVMGAPLPLRRRR